ncbi:MAG: 50S ribosomal protein L10 [Candidatus Bipolaricaulia bacterium]
MVRPEKEQAVQELEERFREAQALVFTDFRGLDANQMVELRQKLRGQNLEYRVVKNRLAQQAAEAAGLSFDGVLEGPTAICFGYDDPIEAFKHSMTLTKEFPNYTIKGGLSEGQLLDAEGVKELAELPSHEELLAQLAGTFHGPIRNLATALNGVVRQLVVGLNEVAKAKPDLEGEAGPSSEADTVEASADEASAEASTDEAEATEATEDTGAETDTEADDQADAEPNDAEAADDSETEKGEST